ncbi:MAG: DUF1127 domain-containing protein [Proteobacteria bacterium]|nr:DUF1127 domain-containing protein [Pseudomonadota bacterium]
MNIWFNAIARAGGIEVAPEHRIFPPRQPKARRNRTTPGLARRVVADIAGGAPLRSIETGVSRLVEGFRAARRHRATIGELSALSDHALKDIGLHRSEIRSVVHEMTRVAAATPGDPLAERIKARRPPLTGTILGAQPLVTEA